MAEHSESISKITGLCKTKENPLPFPKHPVAWSLPSKSPPVSNDESLSTETHSPSHDPAVITKAEPKTRISALQTENPLNILVLQGGPDREAPVSRISAKYVSQALSKAGHEVSLREIGPDKPEVLDTPCDVVFPAMHGPFGEGGPLQCMLEERGLAYVGCGPKAAAIAINKANTKDMVVRKNVPTPPAELLMPGKTPIVNAPCVVKPVDDGSSFGVHICMNDEQMMTAIHHPDHEGRSLLIEKFVNGNEYTVGILDGVALPPVQIVPKSEFYDFNAKYQSEDTAYRLETDLSDSALQEIQSYALAAFIAIGARDLSRVDFIVEPDESIWMLEVNTMPGFTDHSLLPMAAAHAGISMVNLCDKLVQLAYSRASGR